jgi:hypothetical protein
MAVAGLPRCYVQPALGGLVRHRTRTALAAIAIVLLVAAGGCGGGSSSDANQEAGRFPVEVTSASFPTRQQLGQTSLMRLAVRNSGRKALPALTVNVSIASKEGRGSTLSFAIHDPEPGLAQPDRPVWVLAARYPRFAGSSAPAGAEGSNQKTYDFGPLKAGATANLVWKLSAVRTGRYVLLYGVDAGLGGQSKAVTGGGAAPGGSFSVKIEGKPYGTEVKGNGEIVRTGKQAK